MKYKPIITDKVIILSLYKPIYGSVYGIWDKWIKLAKRKNLKLVIKTKFGTATFNSVDEFLKGAKQIKRYYKNPNEPMVFYTRSFYDKIKERYQRKVKEEKQKMNTTRLPMKKYQQLKLVVMGGL